MDAIYLTVHFLSIKTALFFFYIANANMSTQTDFYALNLILFQLNC